MPVYHKLINFTEMFDQLQEVPLIINDIPNITKQDQEMIDHLIITRYSSDMISILPSCRCGETKGEYAIGMICTECDTPVKSQIDTDINPLLWFRRPVGVAPLINPSVYAMLKQRFRASRYEVIDWIMDTTYHSTRKPPPVIEKLTSLGIQRGYNNFVENFDDILTLLASVSEFRIKGNKPDETLEMIKANRDIIFSDYIPLPNKALLIVESTNTGKYVDKTIAEAKDAINMLISLDRRFANSPVRIRENRTAKAIAKLVDFYNNFTASNISPKHGLIRKHVFGTRSHFCFRAVITSVTGPHRHDEIEVPWGVGVSVFREHLLSKLMRIGFSLNNAIGLMTEHVNKYHPILDKLLQELISEAPNGKLYCTAQRNPSLGQGSLQLMSISKFKTDPNDRTVGLPITNVAAFNADFDG